MGFKAFYAVKATLAGIELHRMLRKRRHMNASNMPVYKQYYILPVQLRLGKYGRNF